LNFILNQKITTDSQIQCIESLEICESVA